MTLPRSVADVLSGHVLFELESIDRMYLNVWQPRLQHGAGAAAFFTSHRGFAYASTALMDPMTRAFVADIHHFTDASGLDLVHFGKERKDDLTQRYLAGFTGTEGVLYAGRAQEKAGVWRTRRRYGADGSSYAWLVKSSALVRTRPRCRISAIASGRPVSRPCCASGWPSCRTRSPATTSPPATPTSYRSCRPNSP
jgi:hypothetical protein